MKKLRILASSLSALALAVTLYFLIFTKSEEMMIENGLTGLFAFILFISFLSVRISLVSADRPNNIILIVAMAIVVLSTFQWFNSILLESFGTYLLILLMILFGLSLLTQLNEASKLFRGVRLIFLGTLAYLAALLLIPGCTPIFFDIAFVLLAISSIGVLVASRSSKQIS